MKPMMTNHDIDALVGGYHGDPFRVLGPHPAEDPAIGWEVRAFLPEACEAAVVMGDVVTPMKKRHAQGFFIGVLPGTPRDYTLRLKLWSGPSQDIEDPYRFPPLLSAFDLHLHGEGTQYESFRTMGAHLVECLGIHGVRFAVWAPNASVVSVTGDFNQWDTRRHPMRVRDGGIWEFFLPEAQAGQAYKYSVRSQRGHTQQKSDPYGFYSEVPPKSASVICDLSTYIWSDSEWMARRATSDPLKSPMSTYEVHLGSWMRGPGNESLTYRELADRLVDYAVGLGYTHLELMPIMEHPFAGSWGYQVIGSYAPTSRFGSPQDFMYFVDKCHQAGLAVIADWVPAHFPKDAHGLAQFDGTALYEHQDPRLGEHREWGTLIFNYGRNEVRTFLISNAMFWLEQYHIDGLRVDAVASMLYLDYSRKAGEWVPNKFGGNENLEAIEFLRKFNELAHKFPGVVTIAEESTSFPMVSRPVYMNGLGFTMKWNMGWMHDMLNYFAQDPVYRKFHHQHITFSLLYAFTENFVLPVSHDEVVYGKHSLLRKMPGDEWKAFANVRSFLSYMFGHPGKKLLFMGCEIGQPEEWDHDGSIHWDLLAFAPHRQLQDFAKDLNALYRSQPALYQEDFHFRGFEWIDFRDVEGSVIAFTRFATDPTDFIVVVGNFTPIPRHGYRLGVPAAGLYIELLNSDSLQYWGSGVTNGAEIRTEPTQFHGKANSISLTLPPLGVVFLKRIG